MAKHIDFGNKGEQAAVDFLTRLGFEILECNYRWEKLEIDIIALESDVLVFVEVKTRKNNHYGFPEQAVSRTKSQKLIQAAEEYILQKNWDNEIRFDIVAITGNQSDWEIHHIRDAILPY